MSLTPSQILSQQWKQRAERERVIRQQGPISYEEALAQTKRNLGTAYRPVPQESLAKLGIIKKFAQ